VGDSSGVVLGAKCVSGGSVYPTVETLPYNGLGVDVAAFGGSTRVSTRLFLCGRVLGNGLLPKHLHSVNAVTV
jgi:hypothetical protein